MVLKEMLNVVMLISQLCMIIALLIWMITWNETAYKFIIGIGIGVIIGKLELLKGEIKNGSR